MLMTSSTSWAQYLRTSAFIKEPCYSVSSDEISWLERVSTDLRDRYEKAGFAQTLTRYATDWYVENSESCSGRVMQVFPTLVALLLESQGGLRPLPSMKDRITGAAWDSPKVSVEALNVLSTAEKQGVFEEGVPSSDKQECVWVLNQLIQEFGDLAAFIGRELQHQQQRHIEPFTAREGDLQRQHQPYQEALKAKAGDPQGSHQLAADPLRPQQLHMARTQMLSCVLIMILFGRDRLPPPLAKL